MVEKVAVVNTLVVMTTELLTFERVINCRHHLHRKWSFKSSITQWRRGVRIGDTKVYGTTL